MIDIAQIEATYREFAETLSDHPWDGIVEVNLEVLHQLDLLAEPEEEDLDLPAPTEHFNMLESAEKITLFNNDFLIWIVPHNDEEYPHTLVLVALNDKESPKLEMLINFSGVYNSSKLVLKVLNGYLEEIRENERLLKELSDYQA